MANLYAHGATPRIVLLGADDKSIKIAPRGPEAQPQHLPKFYLFAPKGPTKDTILDGVAAMQLYGKDIFNKNTKFYTHATLFAEGAIGAGQEIMIQRVIPDDAGPSANINVYLDVLETEVPNYLRDSAGNIKTDETGNKVVDDAKPTIPGYEIKWVTDYSTDEEPTQAGLLVPKAGTMFKEVEVEIDDPDGATEEIEIHTGEYVEKVVDTGEYDEETVRDPEHDQSEEVQDKTKEELDTVIPAGDPDIANKKLVITSLVLNKDFFPGWDAIKSDNSGTYDWVEHPKVAKAPTTDGYTMPLSKGTLKSTADNYLELLSIDTAAFTWPEETEFTLKNLELSLEELKASPYYNHIKTANGTVKTAAYKTVRHARTKTVLEEVIRRETVPIRVKVKREEVSTMYPIFEARAAYQGEAYNNIGFSFNSPMLTEFNTKLANAVHKYPYTLTMYTRDNAKASPKVFKSLFGENEVELVFTEVPTKDPSVDANVDLGAVYRGNWYNEDDPRLPYKPFEFSYFKVYGDNYRKLLKKFLASEKEAMVFEPKEWADGEYATTNGWYDFTTTNLDDLVDQVELLNPFTCKTSKNVKLQTVMISDDRPKLRDNLKEVNMSANKPIFLAGGSDGTMNTETFEKCVVDELQKYADIDSEVQDMAYAIESTFWDSGFTLDTKKEIVNFIGKRKDTFVVLSTHTCDGVKFLPLSKARAVGVALNTRLKLAPESTYFGTSVARGLIVVGAYQLADDTSGNYIPVSYDLLVKTAKFAGAGNGKWKREMLFDHGDNAIISSGKSLEPRFIPAGVKPVLWSSNLIYAQRFDRENYFFPALQTVYDNDTSVLNSYFAIMCLCTVTKTQFRTWKYFTGSTALSDSEFKDATESYADNDLADRFAGMFRVTNICEITNADKLRGYSYRFRSKIAGYNMKTVAVANTEIYRMGEDVE